jgi:hypothetical protein
MIRKLSALLISTVVLFGFGCKVVDDTGSSNTQTIATFRLASGEVQGYSFEPDYEWKEFDASNGSTGMYKQVDGDAAFFISGGLVKGAGVKLVNSAKEYTDVWVMDFSTKETAAKLYQAYITGDKFGSQAEIPGYSKNVALMDNSAVDGCEIIANFDKFVILIVLTKYDTDLSKSYTDGIQLLDVFKSKQL